MEREASIDRLAAELADLMEGRRDRFAVTSAAFSRETPEEGVRQMVEQSAADAAGLDDSIEGALSADLAALACDDMEALATKTRTEYARLFLGPREVVAPLHESAYLSGTPRMFTLETLDVRRIYEENGYVMKAKNAEPEDAIGTELEFLRNLSDSVLAELQGPVDAAAAERIGQLLAVQRGFKARHLDRWSAQFVQRVAEGDQSGFYRAWARYLSGVLDEDDALQEACEQALGELRAALDAAPDTDKEES